MTLHLIPPCKSLDLSCWHILVSLLRTMTKKNEGSFLTGVPAGGNEPLRLFPK